MKTQKRFFTAILVLILLMPTLQTAAKANDMPVTVNINNQPVAFCDQKPVIIDGRVLVPVSGVFEKLGFEAFWNETAQEIRMEGDFFDIVFRIGRAEYMIFDDISVTIRRLDTPAKIINGRAMVPLRAAAEAIGGTAEWDAQNMTASIIKLI